MSAGHERVYLAQGRDGEAIFLLVELQLLQRDDVASLFVSRPEDNSVGTLFYLV